MQSTVEKQLLDLKTFTENTAMLCTPSVNVGETSTQSLSREESLAMDRLNTVLISPGSIRFPATMKDPPVQLGKSIEVNLADFHIDQLYMIQQ